MQGSGKIAYKNGDSYAGSIINSQCHGNGTYRYSDGIKVSVRIIQISGSFIEGHLKSGKKIYPDGKIYKG